MRALAVYGVILTLAAFLLGWWTTQPAQTYGGSEWNNDG
ncbi:hypothetical protein LCGC14_0948690 [marine sediment metagenome]|uniref:Uncharacterized protein n=1 Tax=marine sediment metagenome TaxID=412755 RepID=A0A0F9R1F5_9ZZZZ